MYILDPPFQLIDDISGDEFRKLVDLNMISYFLMAKVTILLTSQHIVFVLTKIIRADMLTKIVISYKSTVLISNWKARIMYCKTHLSPQMNESSG